MPSVRGLLVPQGPFIQAVALADPEFVAALKAAGRPYPKPQNLLALLDTDASCSAVDFAIVAQMGLMYKDFRPIHTPSSGSSPALRPVFDVAIGIGVGIKRVKPLVRTVEVFGSELRSAGFDALIGWDLLKYCVLVCNGPLRTFEVQYRA